MTYVLIMFSCDLAMKECQRFIEICYLLQGRIQRQSSMRQEILILAQTASALSPLLSASGFVDINRKTLLTIVNSVFGYLVIVINFNISGQEQCEHVSDVGTNNSQNH